MNEEDFEEFCSHILKEAGAGAALKGLGTALSVSYAAGETSKGIKRAKKHIKPITPLQNIDNPISKIANADNKDSQKWKIQKYAPHATAATIIGLGVAEAIKKGDPKAPFITLWRGAKEGIPRVTKKMTKGFSTLIPKVVDKASGKQKKIKEMALYDYARKNDFANDNFTLTKKLQAKIVDDFIKKNPDKVKNAKNLTLGDIRRRMDKETLDKVKEIMPKVEKFNAGVGAGIGFGLGQFGLHSLGDKYFEAKDKQKQQNTNRKAWDDDLFKVKNVPQNVKKPVNKFHNNRHNSRKIDKAASIHNFKNKAKSVFSSPKFKEIVREDILDNMGKSLIFTGAPALASLAINRNLKGDLSKIRKKEDNLGLTQNNRIVVEIPLDELNKARRKSANFSSGQISKEAKLKLTDKHKKILEGVGRNSLKAISWNLPPAAFLALTGRDIRGNFDKVQGDNLGKVSPGNARIIIETNDGSSKTNHGGYYTASNRMMKMAEAIVSKEMQKKSEEIEKSLAKDIERITDAEADETSKVRAERRLAGMELHEGQRGMRRRQRMNSMNY